MRNFTWRFQEEHGADMALPDIDGDEESPRVGDDFANEDRREASR
jgi:hypothetical protein